MTTNIPYKVPALNGPTQVRKRILSRDPLDAYTRRAKAFNMLDRQHLEALVDLDVGDACCASMVMSGCLDALSELPAGSTVVTADALTTHPGLYAANHIVRGLTWDERWDIDKRIRGLLPE